MTPKEKAEELVDKYDILQAIIEGFSFYDSKQCALIAVDELIKETGKKWWYDVKLEIEKL